MTLDRSTVASRFLAEAASRCRIRADTPALRDLAGEVEWAKVSNVRPDDYVKRVKNLVNGKLQYSKLIITQDYYDKVFK